MCSRRRDFCFIETGTRFVKDGKTYHLPDKRLQSEMAFRSGMFHRGKPQDFRLVVPQPSFFEGETGYKNSFANVVKPVAAA